MNRKVDSQFVLIILAATFAVLILPITALIVSGSWFLFYGSVVLIAILIWLLDAWTVRLHPAETRDGISKALGHKIID